MVKPPKTMQPEAVNLEKAGRAAGTSFQDDSFYNYMARKIDLQRQQFGLQLPPDPRKYTKTPYAVKDNSHNKINSGDNKHPSNINVKGVRFAPEVNDNHKGSILSKRRRQRELGLSSVLKRLKRKHGCVSKRQVLENSSTFLLCDNTDGVKNVTPSPSHDKAPSVTANIETAETIESPVQAYTKQPVNQVITLKLNLKRNRPDLFFTGIVVQVNGYTNPDNETLQRLLHKHGGDLEKYETSRITHIIAEGLSTAKAKIYRNRQKPIPVCYPRWITDCVQAQKLLPHAEYLIDEVKNNTQTNLPSIANYFTTKYTSKQQATDSCCVSVSTAGTKTCSNLSSTLCNNGDINDPSPTGKVDGYQMPRHSDMAQKTTVESESINSSVASKQHPNEFVPLKTIEVDLVEEKTSNVVTNHSEYDDECEIINYIGSKVADSSTVNGSLKIAAMSDTSKLTDHGKSNESDDVAHSPTTISSHSTRSDDEELENIENIDHSISTGVWSAVNNNVEPHIESACISNLQEPSPLDSAIEDQVKELNVDSKNKNGRVRTVGTDPNFLDSFFASSRLSFIGSYKQRTKQTDAAKPSNPTDTKTYVMHVDMDCFFANVVLRKYPQYRHKPVVVSHNGKHQNSSKQHVSTSSTSECATCNYEARNYGITKGMYVGRAKELCPDVIVLHYDFDGYEEVSNSVTSILQGYASKYEGYVEQVSCDESYVKIHLDTSCFEVKSHEPILMELANSIRKAIFDQTQCTASIGVSTNRFLAKMATDQVKPDGSCVAFDYKKILATLKLRALPGVGRHLERKLLDKGLFIVSDIWDLGSQGKNSLCQILGPGIGKKVFNFCLGKDDRPVEPTQRKSIGAECSYGVRFNGPYGVDHMIDGLAKEVERRMKHVEVCGSRVTLKMKVRTPGAPPPSKFLGHGICNDISKCTTVAEPVCDAKIISNFCKQLFAELKVSKDEIRGMGITVSNLTTKRIHFSENINKNTILNDWLKQPSKPDKSNETPDDQCNVNILQCSSTESVEIIESPDKNYNADQSFCRATVAEVSKVDSYDDVELPPLSQLQMSQLDFLPTQMRLKINSKIDKRNKLSGQNKEPEQNEPYVLSDNLKFKQTDVKRMLRLATVKAQKLLPTLDGGMDISLTQLNNLPLKIQLQVVNNDDADIERCASNNKRIQSRCRRDQKSATINIQDTDSTVTVTPRHNYKARHQTNSETTLGFESNLSYVDINCSLVQEQQKSFYIDNIDPLNKFLDANSNVSNNAIDVVCDFLSQFAIEENLNTLVILLRCIKKRSDAWGLEAYEHVFSNINKHCLDAMGYELDYENLEL